MKVFFASLASALALFGSGLWLSRAAAADVTPVRLLVLEVSSEDAAAAARLVELVGQPVARRLLPAARDANAAHSALLESSAPRAVVLDTSARRVQVLERDGQARTRLIEAEATPYLTAFVASELLALDPPAAQGPAAQEPAAQQEGAPRSPVARVAGQLALDVASAYTTRWLARPKLGLDLWLSAGASRRMFVVLGAELVPPVPLHESGAAGRITLLRWDAGLFAGLAFPVHAWRLLGYASGRAAIGRADSSGAAEGEQHTVGLGLGAGFRVERSLTNWLGLFASVDLHTMLRRNAYELSGETLLQERILMVSADFGLVLHTREQ
jgi:hypothetical protein